MSNSDPIMEGAGDHDQERAESNAETERESRMGGENSAAEGDGDVRSRNSTWMRCASQSSLDESSRGRGVGAGGGGSGGGGGAQHAVSLLAVLCRLRDDAHLTDVRLIAQAESSPPTAGRAVSSEAESEAVSGVGAGAAAEGGAGAGRGGVLAHRNVLAACSPYFRAMFTQFDEASMPTITIQNVEPHALEAIVEYIYNPESLVITEDNVQSLLSAASLLQVGGVREACCSFLLAALAPENALGIAQFADLHAAADLAAVATHYAHAHAREVLETEEFLALSPDVLSTLLSSDDLDVPNEEFILDAVIRWVEHDPEERGAQLAALLEQVRLPLVARDALLAVVAAPPLRAAGLRVKDLLIEALTYHLLRPERRAAAAAACARARPRAPRPARHTLLVVGGQAPKAVREVEALALQGGACGGGALPGPGGACGGGGWEGRAALPGQGGGGGWEPRAALPGRRCRAGLAALGGRVYAVGGFNGAVRVRSVDVYDAGSDSWSAGPPLLARRSTLGLCALGHVLYAVGGFDGSTGLSSAEMLDVREGVWRAVAGMSTRRSSVGVAAYNSQVYAVGGYDGAHRQCLSSVERYDPIADRWEAVMEMGARRSGAGVGAAGGALWALGGHDGPAVRRSVERYCAGAWAPAAPMASARRNAGVAQLEQRLYVVGGDDGATNLASVEVLDAAQQRWATLPHDMAIARSYAGVVVIPRPT